VKVVQLPSDQPPPAPPHLRPQMKRWWEAVTRQFILEPHHILLLTAACQAWDRMEEARESLAAHGLTFVDSHEVTRSRPEVQIERDARIQFARLVRELDLDTVAPPVADLGRPPGLRSNRR
jgi:P27 family predicted phage terminase small subunit